MGRHLSLRLHTALSNRRAEAKFTDLPFCGVGLISNGIFSVSSLAMARHGMLSSFPCAYAMLTCSIRICILTTFSIYLLTGLEIFKRRSQLRSFSHDSASEASMIENPFTNPFSSFKITEVTITSELVGLPHSNGSQTSLKYDSMGRAMSGQQNYEQYSVTIERGPMSPIFTVPKSPKSNLHPPHRNAAMEANAAAYSYLKCALLFFVSLIITWVSSIRKYP